jgi:hypothetical protein
MSPHGRPKGENSAVRSTERFAVHPHGRPKGENSAERSTERFE